MKERVVAMRLFAVSGARVVRSLASTAVIAAGVVALVAMAPATAGAMGGNVLYVNTAGTDAGACTFADPCATITHALSLAVNGSKIHVASGTYDEQLVINKSVSIVGSASKSNPTILDPSSLPMSDSDTDSPQAQYAIVDVTSGAKVKLTRLTINGDLAQSQFTGCADDFVGVYYHDASGTMSGDTVTNVELPMGLFGCQDGLGVYVASDAGSTSKVSMSHDSVTKYDKNGITCDDAGTTCTITDSSVTGVGPTGLVAQNGIQFYDAFSGSITGNTVSRDTYTGGGYSAAGLLLISTGSLAVSANTASDSDVNIYLGTDGTGLAAGHWSVTGNTVTGATDKVPGGASGFGDGIQLDSTSNAVTISGNKVTGSAENGISVFSAAGATLSSNTVSHNLGDGIYIGGPGSFVQSASTGNTISDNTLQKNGQDGILADSNSASNQFTANKLTKNFRYDIDDQGTTNTWTGNTCTPAGDSNPGGLC